MLPAAAIWLFALALAGAMVGVGIALHPALTVGGGLVAAIALIKAFDALTAERES